VLERSARGARPDARWRGILKGSGPLPLTFGLTWAAIMLLATGMAVLAITGALSSPWLGLPTGERWVLFALIGCSTPGVWAYGLWLMATGAGLMPCAWARVKEGEAVVARPWGRTGSRRWRIVASGSVVLEKARDRKVPTARNVWVYCEGRRLPLLCSGPIADDAVERMAAWLRDRGCAVTVKGDFDLDYDGPPFLTARR
jgi:hypothetical protein